MAFKLRSQTPLKQTLYEKTSRPALSFLTDLEEKADVFLGKPMDKAGARRKQFEKKTNGNYATSDSVNHAAAGMYTRKAISKKLGGGVLGNAAGVIGSNILGVGHEFSSFNSDNGYLNGIVEAGKDIVNNAIGSVSKDKNLEKNVKKYGTSGMSKAEETVRLKDIKKDSPLKKTAAWTRKEGKSETGGLNAKGVASYRAANPGSKLQTAVTKKPSELKPGSKDAKRRKSFCARMSGMPGAMKKPNGEPTRKKLALDKWNC